MSGAPGNRPVDTPARDRILDSGLLVFAEKGFAGATTKEISTRAKVNEVTLFRHFGTKMALFVAVVEERFPLREIHEPVSTDPDESLEDMLNRTARAVLATLKANRHYLMVVLGDVWRVPSMRSTVSQTGIEKGVEFVSDMVTRLIDEGRLRPIDPGVAAWSLVGMVQSYFMTRYLLADGEPDPEEDERMISGFVSIFLDGIRKEVA